MIPSLRICKLLGCGHEFLTTDARKIYCSKGHADRSRNARYSQPTPATYESVRELRHFGKLTLEGKRQVLLGEAGFSVVMFDIEATHLSANVGRILCCSFKPLGKAPYTFHALEKRFMKADVYDDSVLAEAIRDELEKFDIIVGWNSKEFDIKYINARNVRADHRTKKAQYHIDGMWSWAAKMRAWKGLKSVQDFVLPDGSPRKTKIAWEQWMRALGWHSGLREKAMDEIVKHCVMDVRVLEKVYRLLAREDVIRSLRKDGGIL